jgi:hypothetical protein
MLGHHFFWWGYVVRINSSLETSYKIDESVLMLCPTFVQVMGRVPTMSINKTEGCQVYLSKDALDCEIISAKSSEMNILVPQDDDYVSVYESVSVCTSECVCVCVCVWEREMSISMRLSESVAKCGFVLNIVCLTEGVPSSWAVQDGLGRIQTGDRTHRDRWLIADTSSSSSLSHPHLFLFLSSLFPLRQRFHKPI